MVIIPRNNASPASGLNKNAGSGGPAKPHEVEHA